MSLEGTAGVGPTPPSPSSLKLRPSDRQPDDNWALTVSSQVGICFMCDTSRLVSHINFFQAPTGISQEDEMMQRAVQASMASSHHDDFTHKSAYECLRTDDRLA